MRRRQDAAALGRWGARRLFTFFRCANSASQGGIHETGDSRRSTVGPGVKIVNSTLLPT